MNIAVCVSHVPDTTTKIRIAADKQNIEQQGVSYILNPYDEFAIEEALKLKEKNGGEVVVISAGGETSKETIRKALAMGADRGVLLKTNGFVDSISLAKALAEEIKSNGSEIVLMGKQSIDYDNSITAQAAAEILGYGCVTVCVDLKIDGTKVIAEREIEGGREVVETSLPVVISAQKGLNNPRYPAIKGIMEAKRKPISEKDAALGKVHTVLSELKLPSAKNPGRIIGTDSSAVPELVRLLREEAKVI